LGDRNVDVGYHEAGYDEVDNVIWEIEFWIMRRAAIHGQN